MLSNCLLLTEYFERAHFTYPQLLKNSITFK